MKNIKQITILLLSTYLSACGSDKEQEPTVIDKQTLTGQCAAINNTTYATETLEEGGRAVNGIASIHWRVNFADGVMTMYQSDFVLTAKYSCSDDGGVIADMGETGEQTLNFERHNIALYFSPFGGEAKTYVPVKNSSINQCELVYGNRYVESTGQSARIANPPIEFAPLFYAFGDGQTVDYTIGGDVLTRGIYECGMGELHIHYDASDTQPQVVKVAKDGQSISVNTGGGSTPLELVLDKQPVICTEQYEPVCSANLGSIQCITTPCPAGQYKTYSNRCFSDADNAIYLLKGECGELEGQLYEEPVIENPIVCDGQYDPICGVELGTIQCITAPCAVGSYKTYSNLCFAEADKALIVSKGECGEMEGQPYKDEPVEDPIACTQEYAPVCAAELGSIQCLVAPCPAGQYKTYSNRCMADSAKAKFIKDDECGELEGQLYDEPSS